MPIQPATKEILVYLQSNPQVRARIAAPPNLTLVYAGSFFRPVWQELEQLKRCSHEVASKKLLPDVLASIAIPGRPHPTLLAWVKSLEQLQPWQENGFIIWRSLSGIYASNAVGAVSFHVGSGIDKSDKVFAVTEIPVLLRNSRIDPTTRNMLDYYQRCLQSGRSAINLGLMRDA